MSEGEREPRTDRWIRSLGVWRRSRFSYGSRAYHVLEGITSTYWMFRAGPCHCWAFGKAFSLGRAKVWRREHPVLRRYFGLMELICTFFHARRDYYWNLDLDLRVFGREGAWPRRRWSRSMWKETVRKRFRGWLRGLRV